MPSLLRAFAHTFLSSWIGPFPALGLVRSFSSFCVHINITSPGRLWITAPSKRPTCFSSFPQLLSTIKIFFFIVLLTTEMTLNFFYLFIVHLTSLSTKGSKYDIMNLVYIFYSFSSVLGSFPIPSRLSVRILVGWMHKHEGCETVCLLCCAGVTHPTLHRWAGLLLQMSNTSGLYWVLNGKMISHIDYICPETALFPPWRDILFCRIKTRTIRMCRDYNEMLTQVNNIH